MVTEYLSFCDRLQEGTAVKQNDRCPETDWTTVTTQS